jgi:hypothetical protein
MSGRSDRADRIKLISLAVDGIREAEDVKIRPQAVDNTIGQKGTVKQQTVSQSKSRTFETPKKIRIDTANGAIIVE